MFSQTENSFRVQYLRELWRRLALQFRGQPIAIYGAGRHTAWLLKELALIGPAPNLAVILDDDPAGRTGLAGVPVRRPDDVSPHDYAAVVTSSDVIEERLAERARTWAMSDGTAGHAPSVIRLYEGLPPGPYTGEAVVALASDGTMPLQPEALEVQQGPPVPRAASDPLPLPPTEARAGYPATDAVYLARGKAANDGIRDLLLDHGIEVRHLHALLDWGCSSGRVLRHWMDIAVTTECWGCDIDATAIDWAARHLCPPFRLFTCSVQPRLPLPDEMFDLVYGVSVFTHISDSWDAWLLELRRILKPGGVLLVSVHDEHTWDYCRDHPEAFIRRHCPLLDFSHPLECAFLSHGRGIWSQTFWHSEALRARWNAFMDVIGIRPRALDTLQAAVLLRKT